ncbi:MAG TPA: hypothetical protein VIC63_07305 [Candidatus Limnocylindria bacterium]
MALTSITPVAASVAFDSRQALPARIRFADRDVRVVRVGAVRDERAAYPAGSTPRLTVVVEVDSGESLELVYDTRARRWFVDALEPPPLDIAA